MSPADRARHRRAPYATWGLVALNVALFAYEQTLGVHTADFLDRWGLAAGRLSDDLLAAPPQPLSLLPFLTAMFLHVSAAHLLANMLYLAVFGARVERVLAAPRLLAIYLLGGLGGAVALLALAMDSRLVAVGASGAVAALMGAWVALHPYALLAGLAPRAFRVRPDSIPVILLGLWLASQLLGGLTSYGSGTMNLTHGAWLAHLGGFAVGIVLGSLLHPRGRRAAGPARA